MSLYRVVQRESERFANTPRLWVLAVIAPLLFTVILLSTFSARLPVNLPVLVIDYDQSGESRQLSRQLAALSSLSIRSGEPDLRIAAERVRRGEAYGVVVIPSDYERQRLRGETPQVQLFFNRQTLTAGNVLMRDVRTVVATASTVAMVEAGGAPAVRVELHPLFNGGIDYLRFLTLPMLVALWHIAMVIVSVDVAGRELRDGTAASWLSAAKGRICIALVGKQLPYTLWFLGVGGGGMWALLASFGIAMQGSWLIWLAGWGALVLACQGLGTVLVGLTGNLRMALSLASLIISPAFAYAGLTFPVQFMPLFAQIWAQLLPLTHGLATHVQQVSMASPFHISGWHIVALMLWCLLPLIMVRRWRHLMSDPHQWGRT